MQLLMKDLTTIEALAPKDDNRWYVMCCMIEGQYMYWSDSKTLIRLLQADILASDNKLVINLVKLFASGEYLAAKKAKTLNIEFKTEWIHESGNYPPITSAIAINPVEIATFNVSSLKHLIKWAEKAQTVTLYAKNDNLLACKPLNATTTWYKQNNSNDIFVTIACKN